MVLRQAPAAGSAMETLLPYGLGFLLVLAVLLWVARGFFGEWVKKAGDRSFSRLFPGKGWVGGRRLLGYRKAVESDYGKHALGFFRTEPIDIRTVYVPLQCEGGERRKDVYEQIQAEPRSVVIGPAGAGKSLLLKNSMLIWAAGPLGWRSYVPVMVDLHRCNTGEHDLVKLVIGELHRNRLHRRQEAVESFVRKALDEGRLRLLFDGLDEVGRDNQDRVIRGLRDLAKTYPGCQMVVTCRSAVYHGQLAPEFGHVVQIAEFDDASVRRLLGNCPGIEGAGGPDRLFDMLRKNPPLMRLARSPLLLTMMAYLYVEVFAKTGRILPSSRAEFYDEAITHLLGRDVNLGRGRSLAVYELPEKLAALQRVALALHEAPPGEAVDRLAMARGDLLSAIRQTLPELDLDGPRAKLLLDEIVDRSQLLVPLDRSNSFYQFRHLTMQEYLVARELARDPGRLMACYRADPDWWRETVKLWCTADRDCTAVVTELFDAVEPRHKVLALECLADAKKIEPALADRVIDHFLAQLSEENSDSEAIVRGLGAVAAESRGDRVLKLLSDLARAPDASGRASAFCALALSGRVEAAQVLAPLAPSDPNARVALRIMGELAIPVLTEHAGGGGIWAVDDLAMVGTPAAAEKLAQKLWSTELVATRAAWRLAELLRNPDIEEALSCADITAAPAAPSYDWVWRPFTSNTSVAMPAIAGRIAYLLDKSPVNLIPQDTECIDTRIALPIAALGIKSDHPPYRHYKGLAKQLAEEFVNEQKIKTILDADHYDLRKAYEQASHHDAPSPSATRLAEKLLDGRGVDPRYQRMVELLPWPVRAQVLSRLVVSRGQATQKHWIKVTDTRSSRLLWLVTALWVAVCLIGSLGMAGIAIYRSIATITGSWPLGPEWLAWLALTTFAPTAAIVLYLEAQRRTRNVVDGLAGALALLVAMIFLLLVAVYGAVLALITVIQWIGWKPLIAAWMMGGIAVMLMEDLETSVYSNTLRHCLNADRQVRFGRRSVIAGPQAS